MTCLQNWYFSTVYSIVELQDKASNHEKYHQNLCLKLFNKDMNRSLERKPVFINFVFNVANLLLGAAHQVYLQIPRLKTRYLGAIMRQTLLGSLF